MAEGDRFTVQCPACAKTYSVKLALAGKTAACACGAQVLLTPPSVAPIEDEELQLEAPVERVTSASIEKTVAAGRLAAAREPIQRGSESSWPLKFVGVYGILTMASVVIDLLVSGGGFLAYIIRPEAELDVSIVLGFFLGVTATIGWVIFRLGKGLLDGERSAVHGLLVVFVLHIAGAAAAAYFGQDEPHVPLGAAIFAGIAVVIYVPPILVAYTHWDHFRPDED